MFPKLYGSNSIFDVLMTSIYLYCILYHKAAVFNNVLLYLPMCLSVYFFAAENKTLNSFSKGAEKTSIRFAETV